MGVFLFFIDGFGLGQKHNNLLYQQGLWKHLIELTTLISQKKIIKKNFCMIPVDPALGVEGIPQSATGQTALLTGVNAPKQIGGHITGFPGPLLSEIIKEHSLLKKLKEQGFKVTSANAYSQEYFEKVKKTNRRVSATTLAIAAAHIPFRTDQEWESKEAVFADITQSWIKKLYPQVKKTTPARAAVRLKNIINQYDFVLYEYFLTDLYGHRGNNKEKKEILSHLNGFLKKLVKTLDLKKHTLVITSDHGNIEDNTIKTHTKNLVPVLVFSKNKKRLKWFFDHTKELTHVAPLILEGLKNKILV